MATTNHPRRRATDPDGQPGGVTASPSSGGATLSINGVFSGGGIKGVALAGAAAGAMEAGFTFDHAVGTSAGALVACLVAAGYEPDEMEAAVRWIQWPRLLDWMPVTRVPLVGKALAMAFHRAQCRGDVIEDAWSALLERKGVRTFGDLPAGALRIVATDITHQRGVVFPDDLDRYGYDAETFPVARAVRMSASVPFFLEPVPLRHPDTGDVALIADGALTANFPVRVARRSDVWPIVGFRFLDSAAHPHVAVRGPASLARAVIGAGIRAGELIAAEARADVLLVELQVDRDPLDFGLGPDEAGEMFQAGRVASFERLRREIAVAEAEAEIDAGESETRRRRWLDRVRRVSGSLAPGRRSAS